MANEKLMFQLIGIIGSRSFANAVIVSLEMCHPKSFPNFLDPVRPNDRIQLQRKNLQTTFHHQEEQGHQTNQKYTKSAYHEVQTGTAKGIRKTPRPRRTVIRLPNLSNGINRTLLDHAQEGGTDRLLFQSGHSLWICGHVLHRFPTDPDYYFLRSHFVNEC